MQIKPQNVPFLGVFVGALTLLGIGQMMVQPLSSAQAAYRNDGMDTYTADATPTVPPSKEEKLYMRYVAAQESLTRGNDTEALHTLAELKKIPLPLSNEKEFNGPVRYMAPGIVMYQVTRAMTRRAEAAAAQGQRAETRRWLRRCWELRDHVLETPEPNSESLLIARMIDRMAMRTAAQTGVSWREDRSRCPQPSPPSPSRLSMR